MKRLILGVLPPSFRKNRGEEIWRSMKDEWAEATERAFPGRVLALIGAGMDLGITALMEWGVALKRSVPRPHNLPQDLRWALRNVRHRPGLATATILIMALGIGGAEDLFVKHTGLSNRRFRRLARAEADELDKPISLTR